MSDAGAGRPGARHELVAPSSAPRLDLFIAGALDLSRTQAATLIATGQVRVEERAERASYRPIAGERIVVEIPARPERAVEAERHTSDRGHFLWADGDLPWSYGRDACECRLDLCSAPAPLPLYNLRTSRLGLSSISAHSQ